MITLSPKCLSLFRDICRAIFVPQPREVIWQFLEKVVVVPLIAGSRYSGPLDTRRMPVWRGFLELYDQPKVRYFTITKPTRVGGTIFFGICLVIAKVLRKPGPIGWLDPTNGTAAKLSRKELTPFLEACKPLMDLAVVSKTTWTTRLKMFLNCAFTMTGASAINELGGQQWELAIINEQDRMKALGGPGTPSATNEAEARCSQFEDSFKIVRNCTPFSEGGMTWQEFLAGSQHHPYVPCPECGGYQRLVMFAEPAEPDRWMRVADNDPILADAAGPLNHPQDPRNNGLTRPPDSAKPENPKHIKPCPEGRCWLVRGIPAAGRLAWPESAKSKRTGQWNIDAAASGAHYCCAFCKAKIPWDKMDWMAQRYQLRAHNSEASEKDVSCGSIALLSPWRRWSSLVRDWLHSEGSIAKVADFFSLKLGVPRPIPPTKVTPKHIALLQSKSPRYERQFPENADVELTLPGRPVLMTMSSDVNQDGCRYVIRALMPDGSRYLLAWGSAGGFTELDKLAQRVWKFDHGETEHPLMRFEEFSPYSLPLATCIIDTGWKAKNSMGVYQFIHDSGGKWIGVKGGSFGGLGKDKPIAEETASFNYQGRGQVDIPVIQVNDFLITEHTTRIVLKEHRAPLLYLPIHLDDVFIAEITSPYLVKEKQADGRTLEKWKFETEPHFYDALKYGEVQGFVFEPPILASLRAKQDSTRERIRAQLAKQ